jgi:hypothetical protein
MTSDFAQFASEEITAAEIVGSVGLSRPHQLAHPLSIFLAIGTDDSIGQPSRTLWNAIPAIGKQKWYGQESLPTLGRMLRSGRTLTVAGSPIRPRRYGASRLIGAVAIKVCVLVDSL